MVRSVASVVPVVMTIDVVFKSDGTKAGTRLTYNGFDLTRYIQWDVPDSMFLDNRKTDPAPPAAAREAPLCEVCHGRGYRQEALDAGRLAACGACYGYGRRNK